MRALTIPRYGPPEVLEVLAGPDPSPGPGEVLIRVERAGLNFADVSARVGLYPDAPKPRLGAGVEGPVPGTSVLALTHFGGQADRAVAPVGNVLELPASMSFDQGAALPVNYLTAYHMLFHVGRVRQGDRVLVHMAAGGVGLAVIQLLRLTEGVEIFGTASAGKHALLREAGVHHPIDYREADYHAEVNRLTGGKGVHLVLDALGGKDWSRGYSLLAPAGHLIAFGWANMVTGPRRNLIHVAAELLSMPRFSPAKLMEDNRSVSGVNMGHLWSEVALLTGHLKALLALFEQKKISPRIDRVFPLAEGPAAHRYLQERKNTGKVIFDCRAP
ncbi:MAG: synaptic vesicle VAT-1 family membrane protein [Myxococcaceae bacterium]